MRSHWFSGKPPKRSDLFLSPSSAGTELGRLVFVRTCRKRCTNSFTWRSVTIKGGRSRKTRSCVQLIINPSRSAASA